MAREPELGRLQRQKQKRHRATRKRRTWRELQGLDFWEGMLPPEDPLDGELKEALIRYGEFAEATYDAYDWHMYTSKRTAGTCKYGREELLEEVGLGHTGYEVTHYLYATIYKFRWPWERVMEPLSEEGENLAMAVAPATSTKVSSAGAGRLVRAVGWTVWSVVLFWTRVFFAPLLIAVAVARWFLSLPAVAGLLSFVVPFFRAVVLVPAQLVLSPVLEFLNWAMEMVLEHVPQNILVPYTAWMGFVAESGDLATKRLGRRDIVVAWRGTMSPEEWLSDFTDLQVRLPPVTSAATAPVGAPLSALYCRSAVPSARPEHSSEGVKVQLGFWNVYTARNRKHQVRSARSHARRAVMDRLQRAFARGEEEVSVTVTGHSLGGALATLCAYDLARKLHRKYPDRHVPVTAFTFASPRVGNSRFRESFEDTPGLRQLRVVNRMDVVPRVPGLVFHEEETVLVKWVQAAIDELPWTYSHVGEVVEVDTAAGPGSEVFRRHNVANFHCLEAHLYMLDHGARDCGLVNKWSNYLDDNLGLPWFWWQERNKCVVRDPRSKRLRQPRRDWDETAKIINRLPRY